MKVSRKWLRDALGRFLAIIPPRVAVMREKLVHVWVQESFDTDTGQIMAPMPRYEKFLSDKKKLLSEKESQPDALRMFYDSPLLDKDQEFHLFRQYNFLKYKASRLVNSRRPRIADLDKADVFLAQAAEVKKQIAASNVRLVMARSKGRKEFTNSSDLNVLAEIVSDGYLGMIRSIDNFDFRRGNKFSTYATYAILTEHDRQEYLRKRHGTCQFSGMDEVLDEVPAYDDEEEPDGDKDALALMPQVHNVLNQINPLARRIILEYFGVGSPGKLLKQIGEENGICKERVRQIKERGLREARILLGVQ